MKAIYVIFCFLYALTICQLHGGDLTYLHATCIDGKHILRCKVVSTKKGDSYIVINGKKQNTQILHVINTETTGLALLIRNVNETE